MRLGTPSDWPREARQPLSAGRSVDDVVPDAFLSPGSFRSGRLGAVFDVGHARCHDSGRAMTDWGWSDYEASRTTTPGELKVRDVRFVASKWSRLSAADIAGLDSTDDLVAMLVAKYGLAIAQAQKVIEAAMRAAHR
jgi:hypothetical protein